MQEKYERQMKKGVLDMLVLRLLEEERKYGYQLITELREKSDDIFSLKEGTLYPILYRLEDEGLVESKWSEAENKQLPRKYYLMTDKGRQALEEMYQSWQQMRGSYTRYAGCLYVCIRYLHCIFHGNLCPGRHGGACKWMVAIDSYVERTA